MTLAGASILILFLLMLVGLLLFHHHKLWVVAAGGGLISIIFMTGHGLGGYVHHFAEWHRCHLLYNLILLLPVFALAADCFERCGASNSLAKILKSDAMLLWIVFWLSTILDNIAACMIGGTILLAVYGKGNVPFSMLIGVICASNLGGAGSPVGDTTTVMMFVSQDPKIAVPELLAAFVATIPAMLLITWWAARHGHKTKSEVGNGITGDHQETFDDRHLGEHDVDALEHSRKGVSWSMMLPLLAVPGLIVGNFLEQPGFGAWAGFIVGVLLGRNKLMWKVLVGALPNTIFLVGLVATAEMLPLEEAKPYLNVMSRDVVAVLMGHLSAWFDNIPLTAVCLSLKEFDWGLLAYCVGYGGSAMWFGSSAGVALGLLFKEVYETKRWGKPFLMITLSYWVGCATYLLAFKVLVPWVGGLEQPYRIFFWFGATFALWAGAGAVELFSKPKRNLPAILALGIAGATTLLMAFVTLAK